MNVRSEQARSEANDRTEKKQNPRSGFCARKAGLWFGSNIISRTKKRVATQLNCNGIKDSVKQNTQLKGFTLAEVLITLVIIGVIAALTIPTLMANYRKQEVSARLKKFYSTLSQAVRLAQIENNTFMKDTYDERRNQDFDVWWNQNIKSLPITKQKNTNYKIYSPTDGSGFSPNNLYVLNDGSMIVYVSYYPGGWGNISFYYDINGEKGPNSQGRDVFYFKIQQYDWTDDDEHWTKACAGYSCINYGSTERESLSTSCGKGWIAYCSKLIQMDGWEVKSDYPLNI